MQKLIDLITTVLNNVSNHEGYWYSGQDKSLLYGTILYNTVQYAPQLINDSRNPHPFRPGDTWQYVETFLAVTTGVGKRVVVVPSG